MVLCNMKCEIKNVSVVFMFEVNDIIIKFWIRLNKVFVVRVKIVVFGKESVVMVI